MTKIRLMNIAEGPRILVDVNDRPHSFPCGAIADIDLSPAHIKMFTNNSMSSMITIAEDVEMDDRFLLMLALVRDMHQKLTYNEALGRAREVFGLNAFRARPQLSEIRARVSRIAKSYAAAGFTGFDEILKMEATRRDKDDVLDPDKIAEGSIEPAIQQRGARPNIPRHVRAQMDQQAEYQQITEPEEPSGDDRAVKRTIIGRVPSATITKDTPRPVINQDNPTASPGEFPDDDRTPEEIEAELELRQSNTGGANTTSLKRAAAFDHADDDLDEAEVTKKPARNAKPAGAPARGYASKRTTKKAAKVAPAKGKAKKAGSRR